MKLISLLCLLTIIGTITCEEKDVVRLVVIVGEDVVLPCSLGSEENIKPTLFDWIKDQQDVFLYNAGIHHIDNLQFKGRVSHFPDQLINGNASIIIRNTQLSDSGNYFCSFPRLQQKKFYVELLVGVFAKPRVMILNITKNWALLHCEVRGAFPEPHISWIDNNGRVLPAQEKLEDSDDLQLPPALMLQTNVTKTSIFHCRVAQHELNHTTEVQIYTHICSDETVTAHNRVFIILLILSVVLICLIPILFWMYRRRAMREKLQAIISRRAERPAVGRRGRVNSSSRLTEIRNAINSERHDRVNSSSDSSHDQAKPEETEELKLKAAADEALETPSAETSDQ